MHGTEASTRTLPTNVETDPILLDPNLSLSAAKVAIELDLLQDEARMGRVCIIATSVNDLVQPFFRCKAISDGVVKSTALHPRDAEMLKDSLWMLNYPLGKCAPHPDASTALKYLHELSRHVSVEGKILDVLELGRLKSFCTALATQARRHRSLLLRS